MLGFCRRLFAAGGSEERRCQTLCRDGSEVIRGGEVGLGEKRNGDGVHCGLRCGDLVRSCGVNAADSGGEVHERVGEGVGWFELGGLSVWFKWVVWVCGQVVCYWFHPIGCNNCVW